MPKTKDAPPVEVLDNGTVVLHEPTATAEQIHDAIAATDAKKSPPKEKPEPKPGDADYDWAKQYGTDDLYTHTFPNGTVLALKKFGAIYSKTWLYKIRTLPTEADVEFAALDRASCDVAREVLANLDDSEGDPIEDLYQAWLADGTAQAEGGEGLTPGN